MTDESRGIQQRQDHLSVTEFLSESLRNAISSGSPESIAAALGDQEQNWVTEAVSNQLVARTFLVQQKDKLAALNSDISEEHASDTARKITAYLEDLKTDFATTFMAEGEADERITLSGDDLLRELLSAPGEASAYIWHQLSSLKVSSLASPEAIIRRMQYVRDAITATLWESVLDIREGADGQDLITEVKRTVTEQMMRLDTHIEANLSDE